MYPSLQLLFQHMVWADNAILELLMQSHGRCGDADAVMSHVILAEHIWLCRIAARDIGALTPRSALSLEARAAMAQRTSAGYAEVLADMTDQRLQESISYTTTTGATFTSRVGDILLQVALHGSHHRGQIAGMLRQHGLTPPATDYILYCRNRPSTNEQGH